jgi:hypothetical protein
MPPEATGSLAIVGKPGAPAIFGRSKGWCPLGEATGSRDPHRKGVKREKLAASIGLPLP